MSKERLEEMEELLNEYYENIDDPFASTDNAMAIVDKVGYLINRVQELEEIKSEAIKQIDVTQRRNKGLEERVHELEEHLRLANQYVKKEREINTRLEQQNKCYREAIDYVMSAKTNHYNNLENAMEDIKFVIKETLEDGE